MWARIRGGRQWIGRVVSTGMRYSVLERCAVWDWLGDGSGVVDGQTDAQRGVNPAGQICGLL